MFKKGQSGNPSGRPKIVNDIKVLARQHTEEAVRALIAALANPGERVQASSVLLAYGYGKPTQTVNMRVIKDWQDLSEEELAVLAQSSGDEKRETRH